MGGLSKRQTIMAARIAVSLVLFAIGMVLAETGTFESMFHEQANIVELCYFLVPYIIAGYDVVCRAIRNIAHGDFFDENFLMSIATIGAFALEAFPETHAGAPEGVAVMVFYQIGELFQSYAVDRSRKSISDMMDIAPEFANIMRDGHIEQVDPYEVEQGDTIVIRPGERIPLDGTVIEGDSQIETAALTGESVPREASVGTEVISGCINLNGTLTVKVAKPYEDSTVNRILELVENAADKKAKTENFITRFAKYYTPIVVALAVLIWAIPTLAFGGEWWVWLERALTFLVVSCPCALVISVPLSFFGGIGGASRAGILIKGSNYLEALSKVETVVFDKTGTLTTGTFEVTAINPEAHISEDDLLALAAYAEAFSTHPIASSIHQAYGQTIDHALVQNANEVGGGGIEATVDGHEVFVGNDKLMVAHNVDSRGTDIVGTIVHVAIDGKYAGSIVISDVVKPESEQAISDMKKAGVANTVMLTGDRSEVAMAVGESLGIDEVYAELLPQDKVFEVERMLEHTSNPLAFVGDGINDAPVLTRCDIGIAMGAMGSDAAIEAADIVLMDDNPKKIAAAIKIAKKTMSIVWQNIIIAIGIKIAVLVLAAVGLADMWAAVFADVGVCMIAVINAMRTLNVKKILKG